MSRRLLLDSAIATLSVLPSPALAAAAGDTTLTLPGLSAPARITTDRFGIPHVTAASLSDLYLAWGFVTARDRMWQMEHARRAARGQLWQWFGNRALRDDGGAQLFELATHAAGAWEGNRQDPGTRLALERFAEGVNAYLALCRRGGRPWAPEFDRLGKRPTDWKPEDSVLLVYAQGLVLDLTIPELQEAETLRVRGPGWYERRRRFEADGMYVTIPDSAARRLWGRKSAPSLPGSPFPGGVKTGARAPGVRDRRDPDLGASNIFAVGPGRSGRGAPLVANDVHLSLTAPGPFHAVHVTVPDTVDAAGACIPGLPIIVSGRNRRCAWGVTSLSADVVDLYADTLSSDGKQVRHQGRWVSVREASYAMRFRALGLSLPVLGQKRRYTPHGPVVSFDRKRRLALSARWAALEAELTLRDLVGLERARDAAEVTRRIRTLATPGLNVVAADVEGQVVYQAAGAIPRRGIDHEYGAFPADARHEWKGFIAAEEMPAWAVPSDGYVVNGNNLPVGAPYPEALPRFDWIHDRARRIAERLEGDGQVTLEDARSVQNDVFSRAAERFVPRLLACADSLPGALSPRGRAALDTLRAWDCRALRDRVAPTVFRAWLGAFNRRTRLADAPGLAAAALDGRAPEALRDPKRGTVERAAVSATAALDSALVELGRALGPEMAHWQWGRAHRARFQHPLAWLEPRFAPPAVPIDGDNSTPSVGPSRLPGSVQVVFGPVWRHVVDLAVAESSLVVIPPGNAGDGSHARDHLQRWASHRYVPLYLSRHRIEAARESEWRLEPAR